RTKPKNLGLIQATGNITFVILSLVRKAHEAEESRTHPSHRKHHFVILSEAHNRAHEEFFF
ncbi:MAG TPA: hypothetical protein PLT14_08775, partial [Oscillospiraceae bacterium]|nr:hypothetical protein [Oscillospiraceae bacterium]